MKEIDLLARVALVGVGGALGAVIRYLLGTWIAARMSPDFPWSTLLINVSGSFLAVGVLGGYNDLLDLQLRIPGTAGGW
jgi:CrcB protein